jgi:hypothetical protein
MIRNTAILCCLLLATASFAQDKPTHKQTVQRTEARTTPTENSYTPSAETMTRDLGLNAEQAEKLKSMELETNQQLRDMETLEPKARDAKQAEVRAKYKKMVASVLTPDQNRKLAAIIAKAEKEHEGEKMRTNVTK